MYHIDSNKYISYQIYNNFVSRLISDNNVSKIVHLLLIIVTHNYNFIYDKYNYCYLLLVFKNRSSVSVLLRNRWHDACNQGIQVITSHIFREGNCCADLLANLGHSTQGTVWFSVLPQGHQTDFFLDRSGFPRSRVP